MADFPALPLWTDAYLADTTHLTYAESGIYLAVLMHMWRCPGCRVPNDRSWLERKFRLNSADVDNLLIPLLKEFCQCDGNWWTQKRLTKEWAYLQETHRRQSDNAKARWRKEKEICQTDASGMQVAYAPTPTPTPPSSLSTSTQTEHTEAPNGAARDLDLDAELYRHGKRILGIKAGGVITRIRDKFGVGAGLQLLDQASHKENAMEYVQRALAKKVAEPDSAWGLYG